MKSAIGETGHNRQAKSELKRLFPGGQTADLFKTPKPERLLYKILRVATAPGDIVLDCFLGSGTTAAVAQKTGRRWVGIEWSAETVQTYARPRLIWNPWWLSLLCCGMTRTLPLHPHLPTQELAQRSRQAPTPVEARRWQLLALVADELTVKQAARLVGLNYDYARRVIHRYNREGPMALRDRRLEARAPGTRPLLTAEQQQELAQAVQGPAPGGGLWSGPVVARWIAEKTGREQVRPQRGHDYLRRVGMSPQRPRPRHTKADPAAQEAFKKKSGG